MEVRPRPVQLGLVSLLLLLAAQDAPAILVPSPQCQRQCGGVDIHYPFGIGDNCSLSQGFNISCDKVQDGIPKPFISNVELLSISLIHGTIRVLNYISTYCYNSSSGLMDGNEWVLNGTDYPYRFSDVHNKFTVIGCNTLAYISGSNGTGYQSGCVSTCSSLSGLADGSCSGIGCCQTAIPKEMAYYEVGFDSNFNTSQIWRFSRCSYAVLMETEAFNFSTLYINTTKFNETNIGRAPVVIDWAIRDGTTSCDVAKQNETGTYACLSKNGECVESPNGPGYLCNCSKGYDGNPYVPDGCQDYNECKDMSSCPSGSICHNTIGGYRCLCRLGRKFSKQNKTCDPDTRLIIGVTVGFLVLMIFSFFGYMILQKRKLNHVKQEHFRQHGGMLLFDRMKSERGLAFTVFNEAELIKATDNYDKQCFQGVA